MKNKINFFVFMIALLAVNTTFSQDGGSNKWSVDLAGGVNKAMETHSPGHSYPFVGLFNAKLGVRYMLNSKVGILASGDFNQFTSKTKTADFATNMYGGNLQGVLNLGRIANFEDWTKHISFMVHAGVGLAYLKDVSTSNSTADDRIGSLMFGFGPVFKLGNRVALTTDLTIFGNMSHNFGYDLQSYNGNREGFDTYHGTATIGLTFYLGKNSSHRDWKFEGDELAKRIEALEAELENTKGDVDLLGQDLKAIEKKMQDDDNDGVANYLDIEPNTPEGQEVNTKGQTVQMAPLEDLIGNSEEGLFFTVQLGVFSAQIPEQYWKGIEPIYKLKIEDGTTRYFSGIFHSVDESRPKLTAAKENGLVDAFITAYYKGKRITVAEADLILSTRGNAALRPKP